MKLPAFNCLLFLFFPFLPFMLAATATADPLDSAPLYSYRFGFENEDSFALPSNSQPRRRAAARNAKTSSFSVSQFIDRNVFQSPARRFRIPSFSQFSLSNLDGNRLESWLDGLSQKILSALGNLLGNVWPIDSAFANADGLSFDPDLSDGENSADFESSERIARQLFRDRSSIGHF